MLLSIKKKVIFFALVVSVLYGVAAQTGKDTDLEELVVFVRQQRSDVEAAQYKVEQDEHNEWAIRSTLFPQMNVVGTVQKTKDDIYPSEILQASFSQVLYDPSGARMQEEIAKRTTKIDRAKLIDVKDDAEFQTTMSFLSFRNRLLERDLEKALDTSSLESYQRALLAAEVGLISPVQLQQAEANFKAAQFSVSELSHNRVISKDQLEANSEQELSKPMVFPPARQLVNLIVNSLDSYDTDSLVQDSYKFRTEFQILDLQMEQAEYQRDIARYSYLPSISFVANAYKTHFDLDPIPIGTAISAIIYPWNLGVQATWTFDSFGNVHNMRAAKALCLEKMLTKKRAEFTVRGEIQTLHEELKKFKEHLKAALAKAKQLDVDFEKAQLEFSIGSLSEVDYVRMETQWRQAQTDLENTIASSVMKHEELLYKAGYPYHRTTLFDYLKKGPEKRENL